MDNTQSKKRRISEGISSIDSINERILKMEEDIFDIRAKLDSLLIKKPRKNVLQEVDEKLNTVLDILAKVVTPSI